MSKPRKKISQNLRRTAQRASRHIGYRIPSGACELADELEKVCHKTESDPTATMPTHQPTHAEPIRTTVQHHITNSDYKRRKRERERRNQIIHIASTFLFILLAVTLIIGTLAAILSAVL